MVYTVITLKKYLAQINIKVSRYILVEMSMSVMLEVSVLLSTGILGIASSDVVYWQSS